MNTFIVVLHRLFTWISKFSSAVQEHVTIGEEALHAILKASNGDMRKGQSNTNKFFIILLIPVVSISCYQQ